MADAGYQLITSIIFVITKRDFDYSEEFGCNSLGLVCDVAVEFGLGEGLFYLAIDKDNSVLYVGMSENLRQKWKSHPKLEALSRLEGVKISYIRTEAELLRKLENALIKVFKPPLNLTEE
jgi:hypothetical protein